MPPRDDSFAFHTQARLRALLAEAGASPRRRFGQHFLIDANLMKKLVSSAELTPADCVLEVGAGTGCLTALLSAAAGHVIAVEIDPSLLAIAKRTLAGRTNVRLISGDALARKSLIAPEVSAALQEGHAAAGGPLKLVANLPYDVATPVVINLLLSDLPPARLCFTVQAEVADRFLAKPGTPDYGPVSVISQALMVGRRIGRVPPEAFWPRPKVDSAMLCLERDSSEGGVFGRREEFAAFVRGFFQHRRKSLSHLVKSRQDAQRLRSALRSLGIDPLWRPENVAVAQWVAWFLAAA